MLDTIKTLFDFGKTLLGFKADLEKAELEKRKRIADYLDKVAESLAEISSGFRQGHIPHGACGSLSGYVTSLVDALGSSIDGEQLLHFSSLLGGAQLTRDLLSEIYSAESRSVVDKERALAELELASGEFRALAVFLRT